MGGGKEVKKDKKGFTLVEMSVVMVLICLMGVALIPNMKAVYKQHAIKAVDSICIDLVTLRKQAIATGGEYTLEVSGNKYTMMPGIQTSSGKWRSKPDNMASKILFSVVGGDGSTVVASNKIVFKGRSMKDALGNEKEYFIITISYDGVVYTEAKFEGLTGRYTITKKV